MAFTGYLQVATGDQSLVSSAVTAKSAMMTERDSNRTSCCANCSQALEFSRYICAVCSRGSGKYTLELCVDCIGNRSTITHGAEENERTHSPEHLLVQLRRVLHPRHVCAILDQADAAFAYGTPGISGAGWDTNEAPESSSETECEPGDRVTKSLPPSPPCVICQKTVQRPFWYCLECKGIRNTRV